MTGRDTGTWDAVICVPFTDAELVTLSVIANNDGLSLSEEVHKMVREFFNVNDHTDVSGGKEMRTYTLDGKEYSVRTCNDCPFYHVSYSCGFTSYICKIPTDSRHKTSLLDLSGGCPLRQPEDGTGADA